MQVAVPPRASDTRRPTRRWLLPVLSFCGGVAGLGVSITSPIIVDISRGYGVSEAAAGQLMTVASVAGAIGTLVLAPLLDRFGRRRGITLAMTTLALSCVGAALAPTFVALSVCYCITGLSAYMLYAQILATVGDTYDGDALGRAMAWITFGNFALVMLAMPAVGWLTVAAGWRSAFLLLGACAVPAAFCAWVGVPVGLRSEHSDKIDYREAFAGLRHSRSALILLGTFGLVAASYYGFSTYLAVVADRALAATTAQVSVAISLRFLGSVLIGVAAGSVLRVANWRTTAVASAASGAIILGMYLVPGSLALLSVENLLYGVAIGVIDIGINAMLAALDTGSRGVVMAMRSVMDSAGGVAGPALGGAALLLSGTSGAGLLFALFAFAAVGTAAMLRRARSAPVGGPSAPPAPGSAGR
ncbi:MAG: MFS transporter [Anaerolineae bacterium]